MKTTCILQNKQEHYPKEKLIKVLITTYLIFSNILIHLKRIFIIEEKISPEHLVKEDMADKIATILMHNYDGKLYGEDDTSQPTSCTAPIIPIEATRKKKKRKR